MLFSNQLLSGSLLLGVSCVFRAGGVFLRRIMFV